MYVYRWQLEYPTGLLRTEPPEGETILHAPKRYVALRLVDGLTGQPVRRIEIPAKCRPIFYRVRTLDAKLDGSPVQGATAQLAATVFGWATDPEYLDNEGQGEVQIYLWHPQLKRDLPVPEQFIDKNAINHQITAPVGT